MQMGVDVEKAKAVERANQKRRLERRPRPLTRSLFHRQVDFWLLATCLFFADFEAANHGLGI